MDLYQQGVNYCHESCRTEETNEMIMRRRLQALRDENAVWKKTVDVNKMFNKKLRQQLDETLQLHKALLDENKQLRLCVELQHQCGV